MSIDLHPNDRIEQRLREACHAVIPHLADDEDVNNDSAATRDDLRTVQIVHRMQVTRRNDARPRLLGVAAAMLLVIGGVAVWAAAIRSEPAATTGLPQAAAASTAPVQTSTVVPTVLAESTGSSVPCYDAACTPVDRLAVVPGAADFFAGPESLGTPVVHKDWLDQVGLLRCTELNADGTACQRIEGIAGVAPVSYPTTVTTTDTVAGNPFPPTMIDIEVGTTYTNITPNEYAGSWGNIGAGESDRAPVVVRGHDGTRYNDGDQQTVVWQEQPGLLVWVAVPTVMADELLPTAEGVRRLAGPTTIPYLVVVPSLGQPWDASDNDSDGLVYARLGGDICVGIGWIDGNCSAVAIRHNPANDSDLQIGGVTPAQATQVRIMVAGNDPIIVDTVASNGTPDVRFFNLDAPSGTGEVSVTWLTADGAELGNMTSEIDAVCCQSPTDTPNVPVGG